MKITENGAAGVRDGALEGGWMNEIRPDESGVLLIPHGWNAALGGLLRTFTWRPRAEIPIASNT